MPSPQDLQARFTEFHEEHPGVPLREAALELETTEAELLHSFCPDQGARQVAVLSLSNLFEALEDSSLELRRDNIVLEIRARWKAGASKDQFQSDSGDLWIRSQDFSSAFFVEEESREGSLESLQIFDPIGDSILKMYPAPSGRAFPQSALQSEQCVWVSPIARTVRERPDRELSEAEISSLHSAHSDPLQLLSLLQDGSLGEIQAFRVLQAKGFRPSDPAGFLRKMQAQCHSTQLYFFAAFNRGALIAFSSLLTDVRQRGPWTHLRGPQFSLRVRTPRISSAWWIPAAPPKAGPNASAAAFFDKTGELLFYIAGPSSALNAHFGPLHDLPLA